jgi:hypothetical protein
MTAVIWGMPLAGRPARFWFGEIDTSSVSESLILSPALILARMAEFDLIVTCDPTLELYYLRPRAADAVPASVMPGVSAAAVMQALQDGLIAGAGGTPPLAYLLTAEGRRCARGASRAGDVAPAPPQQAHPAKLDARLLAAEAHFRRAESCIARQQSVLDDLRRRGKKTDSAEQLLEALKSEQQLFIDALHHALHEVEASQNETDVDPERADASKNPPRTMSAGARNTL